MIRSEWRLRCAAALFLVAVGCGGGPTRDTSPRTTSSARSVTNELQSASQAAGPVTLPTMNPVRPYRPARDVLGRFRLKDRGIYVQFDRRGVASEFYSGEILQSFNNFDSALGTTVAQEVSLQLDAMKAMGVNTITFELRSSDPQAGSYVYPDCRVHPVLGLQWPQPTSTELANLNPFLDLVHAKGMKVWLRLVNTHMQEIPPTNARTWLGAILGQIKDHPALDLVLFEGDATVIDSNGDGTIDSCGVPAEPPLYLGSTTYGGTYVQWAIGYAMSLGMPARKLSAEEMIGLYAIDNQFTAGPAAQDAHFWYTPAVMKTIFDNLSIPEADRTYAISMYETNKCKYAFGYSCTEVAPDIWADASLAKLRSLIPASSQARVIAAEFGLTAPVPASWQTERAMENLVALFEQYSLDGGSLWRWVDDTNTEQADLSNPQAVKVRGIAFNYNPVQKEVLDMGGWHLSAVPNGSFEMDADMNGVPDGWTVTGMGAGTQYLLTQEQGQPAVATLGNHVLRLVTGSGSTDSVTATATTIPVSPGIRYTTAAKMRFGWTGDPNPAAAASARPQVFVRVKYLRDGSPSTSKPEEMFRFVQEDSTTGFATFPLQYTVPDDATAVQLQFGASRNGLPSTITLDVDYVR